MLSSWKDCQSLEFVPGMYIARQCQVWEFAGIPCCIHLYVMYIGSTIRCMYCYCKPICTSGFHVVLLTER